MENKKFVVSIGRQYGSGGGEIGTKLAQKLGVHCYDKNILRMTSDQSGIKESYFHLADEKAGNKLLYKIINSMTPDVGTPSFGADMISADNLFRFQSEVIKKLAGEESCVIIGRCAGYVLEGQENLVRIFIYGDLDSRMKRIEEKEYYASKDVKKNVKRIDRERADYYRYYTGRDWEDLGNYDLMLDSSNLGISGIIQVIEAYLKVKNI